jgi:anti-sigma B factor antagonist
MDALFTIQQVDKASIIQIHAPALMEPKEIQTISDALDELIEKQNKRKIVLNFEKVEYLSSRAINIVLVLKKKLADLPGSQLVVCGVGPRLAELIRITRFDKILNIKPTQDEAVRCMAGST